MLKRAYYVLIGGNKSGVYIDGYVEGVAFISIPLRKELSKLTIRITSLCANNVRYLINNIHYGAVKIKTEAVTIDVILTDEMKRLGFAHIKFVSKKTIDIAPTFTVPVKRKCAFIIQDICLKTEGGRCVRDFGLPKFS